MSGWDAYITQYLVASGGITEAALYGKANMQLYASHGDLQLKQYYAPVMKEDGTEEQQAVYEDHNLLNWLTTKQNPAQGFRINGTKYQMLRSFGDEGFPIVYLKSKEGGACIAVTNTLVIIGVFSKEKEWGKGTAPIAICNKAVEDLAELLRGQSY